MSSSRFDSGRKLVAIVSLCALILAVVVMSADDRVSKPMAINGDSLGLDSGETIEQYQGRAQESLDSATDEAFALITFTTPVGPEGAASILEPVTRVNAIILGGSVPRAIPEPTGTETRGDVFARSLAHINATMDGRAPMLIDAVVAFDSGPHLRAVAQQGDVLSVEVLPPDAVWGRFGVRPVTLAP